MGLDAAQRLCYNEAAHYQETAGHTLRLDDQSLS